MDITYARLNATKKRLYNDPRCGFYASSSLSCFKEQTDLINEQIVAVVASTNIFSLIFDVHRGGKHVSDWSLT